MGVFGVPEGKTMRSELKKVIGILGAWILIAVAMWILIPEDSWIRWTVWIPITFITIALAASGIGILLMRIGFFRPNVALVNHNRIKSCMACPVRFMKDNPVNPNFPICKCKDKGMRTCYNPSKVPRWCPHAAR
jgi:hypothetical protein